MFTRIFIFSYLKLRFTLSNFLFHDVSYKTLIFFTTFRISLISFIKLEFTNQQVFFFFFQDLSLYKFYALYSNSFIVNFINLLINLFIFFIVRHKPSSSNIILHNINNENFTQLILIHTSWNFLILFVKIRSLIIS